MQNRAPSYTVAAIIKELIKQVITTIIQPLYLLNLNLIKIVQNQIKDYIKNKYRDI